MIFNFVIKVTSIHILLTILLLSRNLMNQTRITVDIWYPIIWLVWRCTIVDIWYLISLKTCTSRYLMSDHLISVDINRDIFLIGNFENFDKKVSWRLGVYKYLVFSGFCVWKLDRTKKGSATLLFLESRSQLQLLHFRLFK